MVNLHFSKNGKSHFSDFHISQINTYVEIAKELSAPARVASHVDFEDDIDKIMLWFGSTSSITITTIMSGINKIHSALNDDNKFLVFFNITENIFDRYKSHILDIFFIY